MRNVRLDGHQVACSQLRHLNPLPHNTGNVLRSFDRVLVPEMNTGQLASVLRSFDRVLVPEMNTGQLAQLLRAAYLVDVESFCKVQGQPLFAAEIEEQIAERQ